VKFPHAFDEHPALVRAGAVFRKRTVVAATVIGACGLGLIAGAGPALASDTDLICPPVETAEAQFSPAAPDPAMDLVQAFWNAAKGRIGSQAFSFVMNRLGLAQADPTAEQLRAISVQLTQIDGRLVALQDSLNELRERVDQNAFNGEMKDFELYRNNVDSINRDGMRGLARAAENLAKVMSGVATPEEIEKAKDCLEQRKQRFVQLLNTTSAGTNLANMTRHLDGRMGKETLVDAYGRLLLNNNRYLSSEQSLALRRFYDYLEQYQALAATQRAEWKVANRDPVYDIRAVNAEFFNEEGPRLGSIQTQRAALPEPIPQGVLIDRGPNPTGTTQGRSMLFVLGGSFGPESTPWREPDPQGWSTSRGEAEKAATAFVYSIPTSGGRSRELKNWRVIWMAEWNSLVAGKLPPQTGADYLNEKFRLKLAGAGEPQTFARPFSREPLTGVWVGRVGQRPGEDEARAWDIEMRGRVHSNKVRVWQRGVVYVHHSGSITFPSNPRTAWVPDLPPNWPRSSPPDWYTSIRAELDKRYNAQQRRLIFSRETDVNYMGMGSQL
jgi:hypothetical protein